MKGVALGMLVALSPLEGKAASADGVFALKGEGARSCSAFVQARDEQSTDYLRFGSWLSGYITAYNHTHEGTVDIAPWQGIDLLASLLANHCRANPDLLFTEVVNQLTRALEENRLRRSSDLVAVTANGTSVEVYEEILRRLQRVLQENGLYQAEVDGKYGPATRRAIESFQEKNDLAVTGVPDQKTLYQLFR